MDLKQDDNTMLLGIDTGGTFTDFVLYDGAQIRTHKVLSTPAAPEQSILQGLHEMGLSLKGLRVVHGSTVATNAVLEGKGARVAYITNRGLQDVLSIGRQARRELYNLTPAYAAPPVAAELLLQTGGRLSATGETVDDLTAADLQRLAQQITELKPGAVAINLLFSFLDNRFEKQIEAAMPDGLFVSCSSDVLREYREYERGITTWLNAYVGPLVSVYLGNLARDLQPASLSVMRSSGDTCAAAQAGREAVHLILSGPAGGLEGARHAAALAGIERIMSFDMGGTSTDVALIDGHIGMTNRGMIDRYPVAVPMVDLHTIGAGGGSIARVDAAGALLVGPESAGADPGPVCYGRGGTQVTVTDANLVLGRLPRDARLGGSMALDFHAAMLSMTRLAKALDLHSAEDAAMGIIRIANEHMAQALRVISVQRGIDPRQFTLAAFGGAGGLHMCELADDLGMSQVMAPVNAGVLSALGMITAPAGRQVTQSLVRRLADCSVEEIEAGLETLRSGAAAELQAEGIAADQLLLFPALDLCYEGQAWPLTIDWTDLQRAASDFQAMHQQRYGHVLDAPIELVNLRLGIRTRAQAINLPLHVTRPGNIATTEVYGCGGPVAVRMRSQLEAGESCPGPQIICDEVSTIYVAEGWLCRIDKYGNVLMNKGD